MKVFPDCQMRIWEVSNSCDCGGGGGGDLSNYYTKAETDDLIDDAIDTAVAEAEQDLTDLQAEVAELENTVSTKASTSVTDSLYDAITSHTSNSDIHVTLQDKTNWSNKASNADLQALSSTTTAHTANTNVHVTASDKQTWNNKANASDLQALSSTTTAHTANTVMHVTAQEKQTWSAKANVSDVQAVSNDLSSHTANTNVHVTASDKQAWNAKQDTLTAGTGIDITNNVISVTGATPTPTAIDPALNPNSPNAVANSAITAAVEAKANASDVYTKIEINGFLETKASVWCGTETEYDNLPSIDPNTIYLIQ